MNILQIKLAWTPAKSFHTYKPKPPPLTIPFATTNMSRNHDIATDTVTEADNDILNWRTFTSYIGVRSAHFTSSISSYHSCSDGVYIARLFYLIYLFTSRFFISAASNITRTYFLCLFISWSPQLQTTQREEHKY